MMTKYVSTFFITQTSIQVMLKKESASADSILSNIPQLFPFFKLYSGEFWGGNFHHFCGLSVKEKICSFVFSRTVVEWKMKYEL
jgi:hypothetical protein